jgi:GGDEF domain-containing protein
MDPLTDIYNRRHFEVLVSREFARAQRQTPEVLESLWEQSVIRSLRKVS